MNSEWPQLLPRCPDQSKLQASPKQLPQTEVALEKAVVQGSQSMEPRGYWGWKPHFFQGTCVKYCYYIVDDVYIAHGI